MNDDRAALQNYLKASAASGKRKVAHYLYFPTNKAAAQVASELRSQGYITHERIGADGVNWLVLAHIEVVPSEEIIAAMRQLMEKTTEGRGEYDGYEIDVTQ
jgi:hypothetical protein